MNIWYLSAVFFGAIAAYCGYYGSTVQSRRSDENQAIKIESQLQKLGTQIQELRRKPASSQDPNAIKIVDDQYKKIAEEFFRSKPLRLAQEEARTAQKIVEEVQKTQEIETYFRTIKREAEKLAAAYNQSAKEKLVEIESKDVPENLFDRRSDHPAYILLKFKGAKFWSIRIVMHGGSTPAIEFVRLVSPENTANYEMMQLTGDSALVIISDDKFRVSLHKNISDTMKANVLRGIDRDTQSVSNLGEIATKLTQQIIEFEILKN